MLKMVIFGFQVTGGMILLDELVEAVVAEGMAAGESNWFFEDVGAESAGEKLLMGMVN
jgi:hypothetical protein